MVALLVYHFQLQPYHCTYSQTSKVFCLSVCLCNHVLIFCHYCQSLLQVADRYVSVLLSVADCCVSVVK
jgi:hypothetical protein